MFQVHDNFTCANCSLSHQNSFKTDSAGLGFFLSCVHVRKVWIISHSCLNLYEVHKHFKRWEHLSIALCVSTSFIHPLFSVGIMAVLVSIGLTPGV